MARNVPAFAVRTDKQSGCCLFLPRRPGPGVGQPLAVVMREALHLPGLWILPGGGGQQSGGRCGGTQKP